MARIAHSCSGKGDLLLVFHTEGILLLLAMAVVGCPGAMNDLFVGPRTVNILVVVRAFPQLSILADGRSPNRGGLD